MASFMTYVRDDVIAKYAKQKVIQGSLTESSTLEI